MTPTVRAKISGLEFAFLASCAILSAAWCLSAAAGLGVTFDEPTYLFFGLHRWQTGVIGGLMQLGVMPLPVDVVSLPAYLLERWQGAALDLRIAADAVPYTTADLGRVLPLARACTLVFWMLLLVNAWRLARALGGPWAGAVAASFTAAEPSLLAHASLATTDIAVTASVVGFAASLHRGRGLSWTRRVGLPAAWCGVALLSKASAMLFIPVVMLAAALCDERLPSHAQRRPTGTRGWRDGVQIMVLGLALTFLYCGSDRETRPALIAWADAQPAALAPLLRGAAERFNFFSNAGDGLMWQVYHNTQGHGAYLLGRITDTAFWYYFPILATIKLSAPLLLGGLTVGILRSRTLVSAPLVAAAMLLVCSLGFRVQIGIRLILPLVALLIVGLAVAIVRAIEGVESRPRRRVAISVVVCCLAWTASNAYRAWPDALRFTNELWRGVGPAYRLVSDSNYDWGQGVPELRAWQAAHDIANLDVWYRGTDAAVREGPWRQVILEEQRVRSESEALDAVRGRHLAVSASMLYGTFVPDARLPTARGIERRRTIEHLRRLLTSRTPADAGTFLVFDFTHD